MKRETEIPSDLVAFGGGPVPDGRNWRIIRVGRMLYPGGPHALRAEVPGLPAFHVGWRFSTLDNGPAESGIVISHIGGKLGGSREVPVRFSEQVLASIKAGIRDYAIAHSEELFGETVNCVVFVDEDPMVEIF